MRYTNILLSLSCAFLLVGNTGCQQAQQTDFNHKKKQTTAPSFTNEHYDNDKDIIPESAGDAHKSNNRTQPEQYRQQKTETFEQPDAIKPSYLEGHVKFDTGRWQLDDAMIGSSKADAKNGGKSIRTRDFGKISMLFDIPATNGISISHGSYGNDKPASWQLWVSFDQGKSYSQVDQTVTTGAHKLQTAKFKINVDRPLRFEIRKVSGGKNRINIDDVVLNTEDQLADHSDISNSEVLRDTPGSDASNPFQEQNTDNAASLSNDQLLLGNPSQAKHDLLNPENYLLDRKYYVASYSRSRAIPNWVSWHIGAADLGTARRTNDFRSDTNLPRNWYAVNDSDYKGSGFDKGHNCPSGDRSSSTGANSSTFLMDNIIPQAPNNNQRTWEHLESYCREQVKKGNEVYVIMGSYGIGGIGKNGYQKTIANGKITVPSNIWKVIIIIPEGENDLQRINSETTVIAVNTPNDNNISGNWSNYLCTVRDIERVTGYDLLSSLPKATQDVIETVKFKGGN